MAIKPGFFKRGKYVWSLTDGVSPVSVKIKIAGKHDALINGKQLQGSGNATYVKGGDGSSLTSSKGNMSAEPMNILRTVKYQAIQPGNGVALFTFSGGVESTAVDGQSAGSESGRAENTSIEEDNATIVIGGFIQGSTTGTSTGFCDFCEMARQAGLDADADLDSADLYAAVEDMWDRVAETSGCLAPYDSRNDSGGCDCEAASGCQDLSPA